jgi:hypothetical protein
MSSRRYSWLLCDVCQAIDELRSLSKSGCGFSGGLLKLGCGMLLQVVVQAGEKFQTLSYGVGSRGKFIEALIYRHMLPISRH